jgi:hypothetical protein
MHTQKKTRQSTLSALFGNIPSWRLTQIERALFFAVYSFFRRYNDTPGHLADTTA